MIICGTGHRPHKLGRDYLLKSNNSLSIIKLTSETLLSLGATAVISGFAQGFDQMLVIAASEVGVPVFAALPCRGQHLKWSDESQDLYLNLLNKCKDITFVTDGPYCDGCMIKRDYWMVDNAEGVLAYWNGSSGGTAKTVEYANRVGKPIWNLWNSPTNS